MKDIGFNDLVLCGYVQDTPQERENFSVWVQNCYSDTSGVMYLRERYIKGMMEDTLITIQDALTWIIVGEPTNIREDLILVRDSIKEYRESLNNTCYLK